MAVFDFLNAEIVTAYSQVQWNGVNLPRETILNFVAAHSITVADNVGNASTDITFAANLEALAAYNTNGILVYTGSNTFVGRTITGTSGTITVTNGDGVAGNPTITIDATYAGQTSINTVGTITTGTWHGNILTGTYGGTGVNNGSNTITLGGNINTAGALTTLGAFGATFTFTNTTGVTFPTSGTLATTSQLPTLPLTIPNGGTGQTTATAAFDALSPLTTQGDIIYYNGTHNVRLGAGTSGYVLTTQGASANPIWSASSVTTAYETIQSSTTPLTQRLILNFVGAAAVISDNAGNASTDVTFNTSLNQIAGGTWAGASSITTLGTIGTGVWQGTVVGSTYGGTGVNNGSSTITLGGSLTTSGAFASTFTMTNTTSVTFPTSGTLATTSQIPSFPLSLANGGTAASLVANTGGIVYSGASAFAVLAGTSTANQVLLSGATAAPAWSTATYPATVAQGDLLYGSATNTITALTKNTTATRYIANTGTSNSPAWDQVNLANGVTGTLPSGSFPALTGDVTTSAGSVATTIAANVVTYAKFQQVAASSLVGNATGSLANATGITLGSTLAFVSTALQTVAMTGDVTSSANSFSTTIAAGVVSNAKLANMANNTIKGNVSGSTGAPSDITVSNILDILGTAQGDIIYRDTSTWQVLTPGTSGNFLQTQGASANPVWASAGSSGVTTYGVSYPVSRQLFLN